jgi:hypothetical protein
MIMKSCVWPVDELVTVTDCPVFIDASCAVESVIVCEWPAFVVEVYVTPAAGGAVRSDVSTQTEWV